MGELSGRVAIITGSARNIGRATALMLAEKGAALVIHARSDREGVDEAVAMIGAAGGKAIGHLADLSTEAGAAGLVEAAVAAFGTVDILVNNAALRRNTPFVDLSYDEWKEVLTHNLDCTFLASRAAVPHMIRGKWGRIVNVGGVAGHRGVIGRAHVAAAKSGLAGFTKALATELAPDGVVVNLVVPGMVDTARGASAGSKPHHPLGHNNLIGREGQPEEIAYPIVALCLPGASFTTGQTIHVSGGAYLP